MRSDGFYERDELFSLGFREVGTDVSVSRKASFYGLNAAIGDHSRIDDFVILKGKIKIGRFVHISAYCMLAATYGQIVFNDCAVLASGVSVYGASDDYRASVLSSSTVPERFKRTITGDVNFGVGCIVGAHSVVLPNSVIEDGASIGAFALVKGLVPEGAVVVATERNQLRVTGNRDAARIRALRDQLVTAFAQR
jgi:acetyltransferase-like isoleucine patch superfamily enzyme